MNGIRDMFERLTDYELAKVPVGAGLMLTVSDALATAVSDAMRGFVGVPPIVSDSALAYADAYFKLSERLLGTHGQYLVDAILVKRAIDSQFNLTGMVHNLISKVTSALPSHHTAPTSGYEVSGYVPAAVESPVGDIVTTPQIGESSEVANILEAREAFFGSMAQ